MIRDVRAPLVRLFFDLVALCMLVIIELDRLRRQAMNALAEPTHR